MGIINTAAKIGAKKDLAKEAIGEQYDAAKQKYADTKQNVANKYNNAKQNVSEFTNDPSAFVGNRYAVAKANALAEARMQKMHAAGAVASAAAPGAAPVLGAAMAAKESAERQKLMKKQEKEEDARLKSARDAGKNIGGQGSGSYGEKSQGSLSLLFWLAVFAHLLDALTQFQRPGLIWIFYIVIAGIAIFGVFGLHKPNFQEGWIIGMILVAYYLPYIIDIPFFLRAFTDNRISLFLSGIFCLLPILPIAIGIMFPEHSTINKWTRIYIMFWTIVLVSYAFVTFSSDQSTKTLIKDPIAGVRYVMTGVYGTFGKMGTSVSNTFKRAVAEATGQPYDGQAESKVGIYVEDVKPLETKYSTDSIVYVEAKVSAVNLKEPISAVHTICYIEGLKVGNASPEIMINVSDNYENIIDCNMGKLAVGNYEVKVRTDFEFETSSDITYTFVSTSVKNDQYVQLGIDPQTIATYTGGPVDLGLPSLTQPLRIDPDSGMTQYANYPFGVSLKNNWAQGKVLRGIWYSLDTPAEVKLDDCSRNATMKSEPDPATGRNIYRFETNYMNAQESFDAVTCRMKFIDVNTLLGNDLKSVKTFAARARYLYAVEGTAFVTVEKS